jgi:hypothetical protein
MKKDMILLGSVVLVAAGLVVMLFTVAILIH